MQCNPDTQTWEITQHPSSLLEAFELYGMSSNNGWWYRLSSAPSAPLLRHLIFFELTERSSKFSSILTGCSNDTALCSWNSRPESRYWTLYTGCSCSTARSAGVDSRRYSACGPLWIGSWIPHNLKRVIIIRFDTFSRSCVLDSRHEQYT